MSSMEQLFHPENQHLLFEIFMDRETQDVQLEAALLIHEYTQSSVLSTGKSAMNKTETRVSLLKDDTNR